VSASLSLSTPGPLVSALSPPGVPRAVPGRHSRARPCHKAPTGSRLHYPKPRHLRCSKPCRHLAVRAPPDRACLSAAVSAVRARLIARSRSAAFPTSPRFTSKPAAAPHHPLPISAGAHRGEPPYCRNFDRLRRRDPLHGERSPEHPLAAFFSGYTCT
jgi:hypothetical protein